MNERHRALRQWQQQGGQSQEQGSALPEKTPRTTADPGADGQSVYDFQDEEARKALDRPAPRSVHPRDLPPDSNAL